MYLGLTSLAINMFMYSPLSIMYTSSVVIFSRRAGMTFGLIKVCSVSSVKKPHVA